MADPLGDDDHTDHMEREAVVAYLRRLAARPSYGYQTIANDALSRAADAIEDGIHHDTPTLAASALGARLPAE